MKKKLLAILLAAALLSGCSGVAYDQDTDLESDLAGGYFVEITHWQDNAEYNYRIMYAKDTKVKYLMYNTYYKSGITPLYNSDGTLQLYGEEAY